MLCQKCGKHKDICEGGALTYVNGYYERWCRCCILKAQLDFSEKLAVHIPAHKKTIIGSHNKFKKELASKYRWEWFKYKINKVWRSILKGKSPMNESASSRKKGRLRCNTM